MKNAVDEDAQTSSQPAPRSTLEPRKRQREPTVSPQENVTKKPEEKRPKTSKKEEEWTEVLARKEDCKKKPKPVPTKQEVKACPRRGGSGQACRGGELRDHSEEPKKQGQLQKTEINRCLGFGHMAADCRRLDRSWSCRMSKK